MQTKEQMIRGTRGKLFTVSFIKKDGSLRRMNARLGVSKGVKGVGLKFDPSAHGLITAFDLQKKAHRMINLDTLVSFKCGDNSWGGE